MKITTSKLYVKLKFRSIAAIEDYVLKSSDTRIDHRRTVLLSGEKGTLKHLEDNQAKFNKCVRI